MRTLVLLTVLGERGGCLCMLPLGRRDGPILTRERLLSARDDQTTRLFVLPQPTLGHHPCIADSKTTRSTRNASTLPCSPSVIFANPTTNTPILAGRKTLRRWDPVRRRRATTRMPPLPAYRARNPAYFYPSAEATASRVARLREQRQRLEARKRRLSELEAELGEAKAEVDSACADARSGELRERYGAETLRGAREAAKEAHSALVREKKCLLASLAEAEKMVSMHPRVRGASENKRRGGAHVFFAFLNIRKAQQS